MIAHDSQEGTPCPPNFQDVIQSKYLLLTTFTKDGRPKPTAIRGVPDGDKLLVITDDGSWKTKRINNTPWFYAHSIVRGGIDKVHVSLKIEPAAPSDREKR